MNNSIVNILNSLSNNAQVHQLENRFESNIHNFRFHEVFRNNSLNMRLECSFFQSYFLTKNIGFKGDSIELRKVLLSNEKPDDLYYDFFLKFCKANNFISQLMPDLQRGSNTKYKTDLSVKYLLPKLHSIVSISDNLGIPRKDDLPLSFHIEPVPYGDDILSRINLINFLFSSNTHAHICASIIFAESIIACPFTDSNYELAVLLSRLYLCKSGVDPTGCIIFNSNFYTTNPIIVELLTKYSSGKYEDILNWVIFFLENLIVDFDFITSVANSVLAKKIPNWN